MSEQKLYYKNWPEGIPKEVEIPDITLVDSLENTVKRFPDHVVTYYMGFELTYRQMLDIVYRVATKLTELGIKKGDTVALQYLNDPNEVREIYKQAY